jgi:glycosyltransferase involved in cell wall biosynthesis
MSRLTTVIIARNEERNIARCIESVRELGPVIVSDSGSSDSTVAIAERHGAEVHRNEWKGFGVAKQAVTDLAKTEYVLSIDADEAVTPELAYAIEAALESKDVANGFCVPRVTNFCGSWIFHSGWYPDMVLRLFRKDAGKFTEDILHESVQVDGRVESLNGLLLHYSYLDMASYRMKLGDYARLGSQRYRQRGGRLALLKLIVSPPIWFLKKFIVQLGFADGIAGLWIAALTAAGQFLKYRYALSGEDR